ncbi:MAG TPA: lysylphosphatidylglycerol synthase transmembrane domain-containing protein [Thermoanaerobaculia bacterium]|nr:lysylphosphatidylglycerol synthase transmembrane domain-containing protein [Thermoanaerobaculia bacterium]
MKRLAPILRIAVSVALVVWVLRRADLAEVGEAFRSADVAMVLLALALTPLGYLFSVSRWRLLLRAQGVDLPFSTLLRSFSAGIFFNNLLPSTIGGDAVRAWDSSRAAGKTKAITVVLVDRFLGLLTLMLFAAVGVLISPRLTGRVPALYLWVVAGTAGLALTAWLLFGPSAVTSRALGLLGSRLPERWRSRLEQATGALLAFRSQPGVLLQALALSAGLQASVVGNGYFLSRALHVDIPLPYFFLIVPLVVFVMMVPISINAIGVRENAWAFFFTAFGVANAAAAGVAVAWLDYGLVLLQAIAGGIVWAWGRRPHPLAPAPVEEGAG